MLRRVHMDFPVKRETFSFRVNRSETSSGQDDAMVAVSDHYELVDSFHHIHD